MSKKHDEDIQDQGGDEVEIGDPFQELEEAVARAEAERDEAREKHQRALADFQNFQRRAGMNEKEAHLQGVRAVLQSLLGVLDNFDLTLAQDPEKLTSEQLLGGIGVVRDELERALALHGVSRITPEVNEEFRPGEHEAVMQQPAEGAEPGRISMPVQVGWRIGDRVVRPAKVAVAPGSE